MTYEQMRVEVENAYPGESWKAKVKAMSEGQIFAVYRRLKSKGIIK